MYEITVVVLPVFFISFWGVDFIQLSYALTRANRKWKVLGTVAIFIDIVVTATKT